MKQILMMMMMICLFNAEFVRAQALRDVAATAGSHDSSAVNPSRHGSVAYVMSQFDRDIVKAFRAAWYHAGKGLVAVESVVLIIRKADGSCKAVLPDPTRQHYRFTFSLQPGTIAIVHTHPNDSDPRPATADIEIAERFQVPMFTLTITGMFLYDPTTKATSRVQDGKDWLISSKWARYRQ